MTDPQNKHQQGDDDDFSQSSRRQKVTPLWLYDEIMRHIEPDLCSHQIPFLTEKYKNETPKEKLFRMRAYEMAFSLFDACLKEVKDGIADDVAEWKQKLRRRAVKKEQLEQKADMENIENIINNPVSEE